MKILVVDDAKFMRCMLQNILVKAGHEVIGEAANGKEGIIKYNELQPDLVFLDITMPEMDGLQAIKGIMEINKDAKVIMCSAMGQQSMVLEAIKSGAKDFIVKPFQEERIIECINTLK